MSDLPITPQGMIDARKDAQVLATVATGGPTDEIINRLGETVPSIKKVYQDATEYVLASLGGKTYLTYTEMVADTTRPDRTPAKVTNDPDKAKRGFYTWDAQIAIPAWVRWLVQPADDADIDALYVAVDSAQLYTERATSSAAAKFDAPNWFTKEKMLGEDLSGWIAGPGASITTEMLNGELCLKASNGAINMRIPRSYFEPSGMASVSIVMKKLAGGVANSDSSSFRMRQLTAAISGISGTEVIRRFVDASFEGDRFYSVEAQALDVDCAWVEYRVQPSVNGGGGIAWYRWPVACGGPSGFYRDPEQEEDPDMLKKSDLKVAVSLNLAKSEYLLKDTYVKNDGSLGFVAGWYCYRIPVVPGQHHTFGNFSISQSGASAYYSATGTMVLNNGTHTTESLPKTVAAPANAAWLYITVARPADGEEARARVVVCLGDELIPYVPPVDKITEIDGKSVAGDVDTDGFARLGEDANFDGLEVTSLTTAVLIANLPSGSTRPPEVGVNEVWLDTSSGGDPLMRVRAS